MRASLLACATLLALVGCEAPQPTSSPPAAEDVAKPLVRHVEQAVEPADRRIGILLHGYGASERDLTSLGRRVGLQGPIVAFRAPERAGKGYAWFPINFEPGGVRYAPDAADDVLGRLAANIRATAQEYEGFDVVVIGFSQGAMLTAMLAVERPDTVDRAVALSGALPRAVKARGETAPIFMAHGTDDRVVPLQRSKQARAQLRKAGATVEYREYPGMGHRVTPAVVRDVRAWLAE